MKKIILTHLLLISLYSSAQITQIKGRISNFNSPNDMVFKVLFYQNNILKDSTNTTLGGFYFKKLPVGNYNIVIQNNNSSLTTLKNIRLIKYTNAYNFKLNGKETRSETVDNTSKSYVAKETHLLKDSKVKPSLDKRGEKPKPISKSKVILEAKKPVINTVDVDWMPDYLDKTKDIKTDDKKPNVAGQVTAGHWCDLTHWNEWLITNKNVEIAQLQTTWGIFPKIKNYVKFVDSKGKPLTYYPVTLFNSKNEKLWQSTTDQNGIAYFWQNVYSNITQENVDYKIQINNQILEIKNSYLLDEKKKSLVINIQNKPAQLAEIAFVVDATGSMSDEIKFLQVELLDVINRVQKGNQCVAINTGSVFYRDNGDEYITRTMPLSGNPANTIDFISNQSAGGGGDFPEAIDIALQDALNKLNWTEGKHPKIMFLLLDAPPHQDNESKQRIKTCIQLAAAQGIRIVPIAASGIDKATEFLLKYMALITNGEYLYITDDSKIGNSHLKPTGGESKVEYLNDLIVNTINTYINSDWCKKEIIKNNIDTLFHDTLNIIQKPINHDVIINNNWQLTIYPNPAQNYFFIETSEILTQLIITDASGKELINQSTFGEFKTEINTEQWSSGMYIVKAIKDKEVITTKILVMH